MFIVVLLALIFVPLLELIVIIEVARGVGTGATFLLLVAVSVAGAWMMRRCGFGVWRQIQARLSRGEFPGAELVDGLLILIAGALMLTPGFLTDAVGLLMLFPPTRLVARTLLVRRFAYKTRVVGWTRGGGGTDGPGFGSGIFGGTGSGGRRSRGGSGRSGSDIWDVHEPRQRAGGRADDLAGGRPGVCDVDESREVGGRSDGREGPDDDHA